MKPTIYVLVDNELNQSVGRLLLDELSFVFNWDYTGDKCPQLLKPDKCLGSHIPQQNILRFLKEEFKAKDTIDALVKLNKMGQGELSGLSYVPEIEGKKMMSNGKGKQHTFTF